MKKTKRIALAGIITGLSLAVMLLAGIFPFAEYSCPALAGIFLVFLVIEFNKKTALIAYIAISILSLLTLPNKEASILFTGFLGFYPIIKSLFEQVKSRFIEWALKLLLFNTMIISAYIIMIYLFNIQILTEQLDALHNYGLAALFILANIAFIIYDYALTGVIFMYLTRIKPKLH